MACPTCDHTMQNIGQTDRGDNIFHCPRCGTVKVDAFGQHGDKVYVPKLVERCREYDEYLNTQGKLSHPLKQFNRLGIAEAINTPENRNL